jgi:ribose transport system substrate-binding protein
MAAAQALLAQVEKVPTSVGPTAKLTKAAPTGKTVVYMQCEVPQCTSIGAGVEAAAKAVGWSFKSIPFQTANPATLVTGLQSALQYHPVGVILTGSPEAVWSSVIPAYKAAGVPIVPAYVGPVTADKTVVGNVGGPLSSAAQGHASGADIIVDSQGKGNVLFMQFPSFGSSVVTDNAVSDYLKQNCPDCKESNVSLSGAQLSGGQVPGIVVSALERDPSIDYVYNPSGSFDAGLPAALKSAGLSGKVKIVGNSAETGNEQNVLDGTEMSYTSVGTSYIGWACMDMMLRAVVGDPIPAEDGLIPFQLLTKTTFQGQPRESYDVPTNFEAQFKALWLVS